MRPSGVNATAVGALTAVTNASVKPLAMVCAPTSLLANKKPLSAIKMRNLFIARIYAVGIILTRKIGVPG